MISDPHTSPVAAPPRAFRSGFAADVVLAVIAILIVGVYFRIADSGVAQLEPVRAADQHYNRLTDGFRSGTLSLKREAPAGLANVPDPYDPAASAPYRLEENGVHDVSYFRGRLYLYFGVTPVLLAFWPWVALTGNYLSHAQATAALCAAGFLASAWLLHSCWRRCFPEVSVAVAAAAILALGAATSVPLMLERPEFYEVAVSGGYAMAMVALASVGAALFAATAGRRDLWVAIASLASGLAVGSRPSLLFTGAILLVPLADAWRPGWDGTRPRVSRRLALATFAPILAVGLGLAVYNDARFGNPLEFGYNYQLAGDRLIPGQFFGLGYLWFNFRLYFLAPLVWSSAYPFVSDATITQVPPGHLAVTENPLALLRNVPFVWLAVAAPLAWRHRAAGAGSRVRGIVVAAVLSFLTAGAIVCLFYAAANRYEVDFAPPLVFVAAIGLLGLERWAAGRPVAQRLALRAGWVTLLAFSVATNWLAAEERAAMESYALGRVAFVGGEAGRAVTKFQTALRIKPSFAAAHNELGIAYSQVGLRAKALAEFEEALHLQPGSAGPRLNLALALAASGRVPDALSQFQRVIQFNPNNALAHYNLGLVLAKSGRMAEAADQLTIAIRLAPREPAMRQALISALFALDRLPEAVVQSRALLQLRPGDPDAQSALDVAEAALKVRTRRP